MGFGRSSIRLLATLLVGAIPPVVAVVLIDRIGEPLIARLGTTSAALLVIAVTIGWVVIVTILAWRAFAGETRSMVQLAEQGTSGGAASATTGDDALTAAQRRLATALAERNRQIADLAAQVRAAPIGDDPAAAAHAMVDAIRNVSHDPTWVLAVLQVAEPEALAAGVYGPDPTGAVEPLTELHRWASTLELLPDESPAARHADGPWGAFVVADMATGEQFAAVLLAPWEGRAAPTPAELGLFSLLGQHAATTIEHALLVRRLRTQTEELNRMAAVQGDFLRGITHDLQTPLTSIRALASELGQSKSIDAAARIDMETIAHQADRLRRMVGQLLAVSRLEVGALTPLQEVFRLEPIVRHTWDALRPTDRGFVLEVEGPPHLVVADAGRMEQVLWALLDNAVKYSQPGSVIGVRIAGRTTAGGGLLSELAIRDEGIGMSPATRRRASEQFFRADEARRLVPDGSGVGLYAARGLVEAMGGSLRIKSEVGRGTTVTIRLMAEAAEEPSPAGAAKG